jgi:phosphoribosylformylglycinamidine synthase
MPKPGILDPQGRAVEQSLPHLDVRNVGDVRVGRRVELTVEAPDAQSARAVVERLASELFANPLIETWSVEAIEGVGDGLRGVADAGGGSGVAEAAR